MSKIDTHIHGNYSLDSDNDYFKLCRKAVDEGYSVIAFTEHYDLLDSELVHWGLPPLQKYITSLNTVRKSFPELTIVTGIELGEPHRVMDFASRLLNSIQCEKDNASLQYIIGSLHVTRSGLNVSLPLNKILTENDIREYYEENLEMVQLGGFDTLGHLGIFKRGLNNEQYIDESHIYPIIDEIFREMIKKDICLEVNNSGFKSNHNDTIPDFKTLKRYMNAGGELITVSSDSHDFKHFNRFYNKTLDNLREIGFRDIYWKIDGTYSKINI